MVLSLRCLTASCAGAAALTVTALAVVPASGVGAPANAGPVSIPHAAAAAGASPAPFSEAGRLLLGGRGWQRAHVPAGPHGGPEAGPPATPMRIEAAIRRYADFPEATSTTGAKARTAGPGLHPLAGTGARLCRPSTMALGAIVAPRGDLPQRLAEGRAHSAAIPPAYGRARP
jgi:hypothetical protein